MTNPKIETDLSELLLGINGKLDKISSDITDLKVGQAKTEVKLESLAAQMRDAKEDLSSFKTESKEEFIVLKKNIVLLQNDIADLKGAKSLITPIVVAVSVSVLTLVLRSIPIN